MKAKKLRKKLKKVPDDVEVMILAYGYSQSMKEKYSVAKTIEDMEAYQFIIAISEW